MKRFILFLPILWGISLFGQNRVQRIDPPNWWIGMEHSQIQILLYGDNIAELQTNINYEGVNLLSQMQLENPNYLFLNVAIAPTANAGNVVIQLNDKGSEVEQHNFPIYQREDGRTALEGFNSTDAIYLITPDRFANGDPTNDNLPKLKEKINRSLKGGRHGGDIAGIDQHLDYIKNLGFTAIWLNPLLENDMETYSYHGYSTTDFYKVDERFGSNEDYKKMVDRMRSMDLKLIMDMIVNHCGSNHWWMDDLPSQDWINQWETYTETNHRKTLLQDPYASDVDRKQFTDGWFVPTMPDLNQRQPQMAKYLIQNSIWWVEYLGLAGIRMDTYPYPDMDFMTDWTEAMMLEYPDLNIVGEEWYEEPTIVSYWQKGKNNPNGYESALKSVMDFPLQTRVKEALTDEEGWKTGWVRVYELLAQDFLYPDPQNLVIFPDNHDMSRIYSQVNEDYDLYRQAIAFFATMRGIPQYYYGTEILMQNRGTSDHGVIRSDFPGGWAGDAVNGFTGEGLTAQQQEAQTFMRNLLHWRQTASAVHSGKLKHFIPMDGIYVYFRYDEEQRVMVIFNKNDEAKTLELDRFAEVLKGHGQAANIITGEPHSLLKPIELKGKDVKILQF